MKDYNKENIPLAKALRKNMTPWERKLWYDFLRNYPIRFQRQKALGNYIADFYCAKARLVVELDGGGHYTPEQARKDEMRTNDLASMKLTVVRICNLDIDRNFRGVCEYIDRVVSNSLPQSASLPSSLVRGSLTCCCIETISKNRPMIVTIGRFNCFMNTPLSSLFFIQAPPAWQPDFRSGISCAAWAFRFFRWDCGELPQR